MTICSLYTHLDLCFAELCLATPYEKKLPHYRKLMKLLNKINIELHHLTEHSATEPFNEMFWAHCSLTHSIYRLKSMVLTPGRYHDGHSSSRNFIHILGHNIMAFFNIWDSTMPLSRFLSLHLPIVDEQN